jgi:type III restriction enzyme
MATGSGKTLMMASLIINLYEKGYRNFIFFVNSTNIIEKTKENFINKTANKYLFSNQINIGEKNNININSITNLNEANNYDINIIFTTIQKLHKDLEKKEKENSSSYEDYKNSKVVLLADESHHLNAMTKSNLSQKEKVEKVAWENSVSKILKANNENLLLEFTATIDLNNKNIKKKYENKILYKYDLAEFRKDGFSKEIKIKLLDMENKYLMLQAVLLSQYRLKISQRNENKLFIKPVILFKENRSIKKSEENQKEFNELIDNLTKQDIEKLFLNKKENDILYKIQNYFIKMKYDLNHLVNEI